MRNSMWLEQGCWCVWPSVDFDSDLNQRLFFFLMKKDYLQLFTGVKFVFFSDRKTNTCWVFSCCLGSLKFEIVVITLWWENRTLWDPSLLWIFYSNHRLSRAITQVCSSLTSYYTSSGYWSGNGAHTRLPLTTGCQHGKLPSAALNPCLIDNNYRQNPPYHRDTAQQLLNMAHSKIKDSYGGYKCTNFIPGSALFIHICPKAHPFLLLAGEWRAGVHVVEAQWHSRQPPAGLLMTAGVSGDGIGWSFVA